jgi:drug/metabolite transporter (DMT)-like permease
LGALAPEILSQRRQDLAFENSKLETAMTPRRYLILFAVSVGAAFGDFFLKMGMNRGQSITLQNLDRAVAAVFNPLVAIGILFLIGFFAAYLTALSWADLTFVLPATGIGYVITALLSVFFLHEHVSVARWIGILLITCGVGFVAHGPSRTEREIIAAEQKLEMAERRS